MTLHSERGESNKTNAKKVLYKASYEVPLTKKTRHESLFSKDFVSRDFLKKTEEILYSITAGVRKSKRFSSRDFLSDIFFERFFLRKCLNRFYLTYEIFSYKLFFEMFPSRDFLQDF